MYVLLKPDGIEDVHGRPPPRAQCLSCPTRLSGKGPHVPPAPQRPVHVPVVKLHHQGDLPTHLCPTSRRRFIRERAFGNCRDAYPHNM